MSIRPEGGWGAIPPQKNRKKPDLDLHPQGGNSAQPRDTPRRSYLTCKVCDRGTLRSVKTFRMSGPAVAIGFILLIPSICGMLFSGLLLLGALTIPALTVPTAMSSNPAQSNFDAAFRSNCAKSARQQIYSLGILPSQAKVESFCECGLSIYKETNSMTTASQTCNQRAQDGTLDQVGSNVDALYSNTPQQNITVTDSLIPTVMLSFVGSAGAVAMGIACFVGGLLGWLLVMRKRVLQCDTCGAVVNAS